MKTHLKDAAFPDYTWCKRETWPSRGIVPVVYSEANKVTCQACLKELAKVKGPAWRV